jgi:RNA polymerase sigma-70 factor (ECF subfamily)
MNENNLIARINKNPEVFSEVIEAYQDKLLRYIMRISNISYEEAENLLQEIFIRVYRYINEYDSRYSFEPHPI